MENEKLIVDLTILGFFIFVCIMAGTFRFENKKQFLIDIMLGFTIGCSCYLLLNNWFEDTRTKVGITGIVIICSRPLYEWANIFIKDWLTKIIVRRKKNQAEQNSDIETRESGNDN